MSKKLHVLMMNIVIPLFTLLPISFSYVKYILSGDSNESFQQMYPAT